MSVFSSKYLLSFRNYKLRVMQFNFIFISKYLESTIGKFKIKCVMFNLFHEIIDGAVDIKISFQNPLPWPPKNDQQLFNHITLASQFTHKQNKTLCLQIWYSQVFGFCFVLFLQMSAYGGIIWNLFLMFCYTSSSTDSL